jgi:hypothetical protein
VAVDSYDMFNQEEKRWDRICHVKTSKKDREEKAYRSTLGFLVLKPEGTAVSYDNIIGGPKKTWAHKEYALGTRCSENAIEDQLYENFTDFFKDLGISAAEQPEVMLAEGFNNATATTYHTAADALAWASASHTRLDGSTYSNYSTAYADLTYTAFWATAILLENQYDHRQKRVRMKLKGLIHPPQLNRQAIETLKSTDRPDSTNRAVSAIAKKYGTSIDDIDWAYMTDADMWVLKGDNHDLIWFWRVRPQFSKEPDFETGDVRCKVRLRGSLEMGDPRGFYFIKP